jgi:hypothetical protein
MRFDDNKSAPMTTKFRQCIAVATAMLCVLGATVTVNAQETAATDDESLAKAAQNPIASMISLPFQNNTNFNWGPQEGTQNVLNVQPVWPFKINDNWNLVTRTIIPIVTVPGVLPGQGSTTGLGDTTVTGFFVPNGSGDFTWGVGPVVLLPTSSDDLLGGDEWALGASVVVLTMPGSWVVGSLFSNVWGEKTDTGRDINRFTWQYFVNYNLPNGWYLTSAPIITADWEADSDQRWTVPFGGGFGKIFRIGKQPLNFNAQVYYNSRKPDIVGDWSLRLQLQLMFPK